MQSYTVEAISLASRHAISRDQASRLISKYRNDRLRIERAADTLRAARADTRAVRATKKRARG